MKMNLIAVAVAAALTAPMVASAADADISLFADARVRYANFDNTSATGGVSNDNTTAQTDSRVRLGFKAKAGNSMITARMKMTNGTHGAGAAGPASGGDVDTDYGYMSTKVAGMIDVAGGRMVANWGNKLLAWDGRVDRVLLSTSMINNVWIGLSFDKMVENFDGVAPTVTGDWKGDDDNSSMKVLVKAKVGAGNLGVLYAMDDNNTAAGTTGDVSGNVMDVYYNGKLGPVALGIEYASKSGKAYETSTVSATSGLAQKADKTALQITASMKAGPANVTAVVVTMNDGYTDTSGYVGGAFSTVGTGANGSTALMNLGTSNVGETLTVFGVVAGMPVNDALSVQGGFGMATLTTGVNVAANTQGDTKIAIFDLQAKYKVDANTSIQASYGILNGETTNTGAPADTSDNTVMGVMMSTKF